MRTTSLRSTSLLLLALLAALPVTSEAQRRRRASREYDGTSRGAVGGALDYGAPVGDFRRYVKQGFGLDGFFRWNADPRGIVSLRVDGGFLSYGREMQRVPLSGTIGGRILVDLTTSNNIVWGGIGPQLTLPSPYLRPYANASIGFSYFFTESSVEGSNQNNDPFASTTNYDDGTFAWGVGGGFLIPFRTSSGEAAIDIGVRLHKNGEVRYLRRGSIIDMPDGSIVIQPIQSEANLLTWRLGFSITIP